MEAYYLPLSGLEHVIERKKTYTIAMVSFIALGFDGYTSFPEAETLVGVEGAMTDTNLMLQVFGYSPSDPVKSYGSDDDKDETTHGIERAREAIILHIDDTDRLPVIGPVVDGRIRFVEYAAL